MYPGSLTAFWEFGLRQYLSYNYEFNPVQALGRLGDMGDDSAETLFQSFLGEAIVTWSDVGIDVHTLTLSIQHIILYFRYNERRRRRKSVLDDSN